VSKQKANKNVTPQTTLPNKEIQTKNKQDHETRPGSHFIVSRIAPALSPSSAAGSQ